MLGLHVVKPRRGSITQDARRPCSFCSSKSVKACFEALEDLQVCFCKKWQMQPTKCGTGYVKLTSHAIAGHRRHWGWPLATTTDAPTAGHDVLRRGEATSLAFGDWLRGSTLIAHGCSSAGCGQLGFAVAAESSLLTAAGRNCKLSITTQTKLSLVVNRWVGMMNHFSLHQGNLRTVSCGAVVVPRVSCDGWRQAWLEVNNIVRGLLHPWFDIVRAGVRVPCLTSSSVSVAV